MKAKHNCKCLLIVFDPVVSKIVEKKNESKSQPIMFEWLLQESCVKDR